MSTENETQQKKFATLLEWLEELKFSGTQEIQHMMMNMLEAWLSTDYADKPSARNQYYYDAQLVSRGMALVNMFTKEDFNALQNIIRLEHVS